MQETNNKDNSDGQEPKSNALETDHFLKFHIILINCHAVDLSFLNLLKNFIQILNSCINFLAVFCFRDECNIRELDSFKINEVEVLSFVQIFNTKLILSWNCSITINSFHVVLLRRVFIQNFPIFEKMRELVVWILSGSHFEMVRSGIT